MSAMQVYNQFLALKNHFTKDSYDYFKYHGKTNASVDSFMKRPDRFKFQRLSKLYKDQEMEDFLIANFIKGKTWVNQMFDDDAGDNYMAYRKRKESLSYTFGNELDKMFLLQNPNLAFKATSDYALPIRMYLQGDLSLESFAILSRYLNLREIYDAKYGEDDIVWGKISMLLKKFTPFLAYDDKKIKTILKEKINENLS